MSWREPVAEDLLCFEPEDVFEAGLRNHHISNTAYPIAHDSTFRPYRVERERCHDVALKAWAPIDALGLYMHVPFCETRCSFCEYTVVRSEEARFQDDYVRHLLAELELYRDAIGTEQKTLFGFDIGGGTPGFLEAENIARLVEAARSAFRFEPTSDISIETTPKLAAGDRHKLERYRACGIDRLSMGIQVLQPDLLRMLNRSENGAAAHYRAVENIRAAGFRRLNVDLMYGFAGQSLESWRATLEHAIALGPEYITLYRMRYKLTRISHQAHEVSLESVRPLIRLSKQLLEGAGYAANPGKTTYSRVPGDVGTSTYLARRVIDGLPYLGLGLGAQSFTHTSISYNDGAVGKNLKPYFRSVERASLPLQDLYDLPARHMMAKMCAVSFYFGEIDTAAFARKFGVPLDEVFTRELEFLAERELMTRSAHKLSLTPLGALNLPGVIALFFAPSVQNHLVHRDPSRDEDFTRNRRLALKVAGNVELTTSNAELAGV